jgi:DegV family protein with EDD domain
MEQVVGIVTDSSCDLPRRLVERLKIAVAPLVVRFGPEVYQDGELSVEEFWEKAAGPHHPSTSQPPVGVFEELYERLVAQGKRVLCLTITGKHSCTNTTNSFTETEHPTFCFALSLCFVPASLHGRPDVDRTLARMA